MENKDIANKIVKIAESIVAEEQARLDNSNAISFFDASDELESIEAELDRLSADITDNVEIIDEEDIEGAKDAGLDASDKEDDMEYEEHDDWKKDIAASLLDLAKELTEE